eukprot:gene13185-15578_t
MRGPELEGEAREKSAYEGVLPLHHEHHFILDACCGSGTTSVAANMLGLGSVAFDRQREAHRNEQEKVEKEREKQTALVEKNASKQKEVEMRETEKAAKQQEAEAAKAAHGRQAAGGRGHQGRQET